MKRYSKTAAICATAVFLPLALFAQQTISFGPNKGQPVQTQNMIDNTRHDEVVQKIAALTVQVKASNDATNQLLTQLIQLQAQSNKQMLAFMQQKPISAPMENHPAATQNTPQTASSEGVASTAETLALQRTVINRLEEQNNLLKLTNTLINKMSEEQKWSNTLMQSIVEGKKR